jgi:hypothetical protein
MGPSTQRKYAQDPDGEVPGESVHVGQQATTASTFLRLRLPLVRLPVKVQVAVEGVEPPRLLLINPAFLDVRQELPMWLPEVAYDRASASAEADSLMNCDRATLPSEAWGI